jgi:sensor histidine kinase YesM
VVRSRRFNLNALVIWHILAWVLFFSLPLLLHPPFNNMRIPETSLRLPRFDLYHTVSDLMLVGIFYLNVYVLLPRVNSRRSILWFVLIQLGILAVYTLVNDLLFREITVRGGLLISSAGPGGVNQTLSTSQFLGSPPRPTRSLVTVRDLFPYMLILACSVAYRMVIDRIRSDRLVKERENETLKTELLLLRSQINPHFMFNVLNNMVSLARKGSDQLESSLIKLSSLMRYMYFEATDDKVLLSKEIDYIESYIDIQEQRFMGSVTIEASLEPQRENYVIEPMLLVPFVENAFKHGTGLVEDARIRITLKVENGTLHFYVANKYSPDQSAETEKATGTGLVNVKRRLSLLYGDRYRLDIHVRDDWYYVNLELNLN